MSHAVRIAAAVVAVACAFLAGCGDDESDEVRAVAADYLRAVSAGDPEACELMSESELDRVGSYFMPESDDPLQACRAGIEKPLDSAAMSSAAERVPNAELRVSDGLATVSIDAPSEGRSGAILISLVREDDAWKVDGSG